MHTRKIFFFTIFCFWASASAVSILDIFSWNLEPTTDTEIQKREETEANNNNNKNCACDGPSCMCCVDFNFTFIDLGGPGCVRVRYISDDNSLIVNVSHGENVLHSERVVGPNPEPTCISLLTNLAQICARFSNLIPIDTGLRGCLSLEPKLLGEVQAQFDIGCFRMDKEGMYLDTTDENNAINNEEDTNEKGENEEEILGEDDASTAEGLALFSDLFGLNFGKPDQDDTESESQNKKDTDKIASPNSEKSTV